MYTIFKLQIKLEMHLAYLKISGYEKESIPHTNKKVRDNL